MFVITYRNYLENVSVHRFEDAPTAKAWLDAQTDQALSGFVAAGPLDIGGSKKFMVDLFNALAREGDTPIGPNGFNNKETGQNRIFARLNDNFGNAPVTAFTSQPTQDSPATESTEENDMTTKKKAARKTNGAAKKPRAKSTNSIQSIVERMVARERGATKKEIIAEILAKVPGRDETKTDNTVRGLLSVLGRAKGTDKVTKTKDDKRGNVYSR